MVHHMEFLIQHKGMNMLVVRLYMNVYNLLNQNCMFLDIYMNHMEGSKIADNNQQYLLMQQHVIFVMNQCNHLLLLSCKSKALFIFSYDIIQIV
jgi:FixJ family two-component response regulator